MCCELHGPKETALLGDGGRGSVLASPSDSVAVSIVDGGGGGSLVSSNVIVPSEVVGVNPCSSDSVPAMTSVRGYSTLGHVQLVRNHSGDRVMMRSPHASNSVVAAPIEAESFESSIGVKPRKCLAPGIRKQAKPRTTFFNVGYCHKRENNQTKESNKIIMSESQVNVPSTAFEQNVASSLFLGSPLPMFVHIPILDSALRS